jgi:hypothetical protein
MATFRVLSALFMRNGNFYVPTELTRGPWDPNAQHGGAPGALIAGALEQIGDGRPFARIGVHLLKPVPLTPLELTTTVERDGKRVRRLRAELTADGEAVCFGYALQIQGSDEAMPDIPLAARIDDPPRAGEPPPRLGPERMFAGDAIQVCFVRGQLTEPGPATAWFRLRVPVVDGERVSQLQRTMAAADFPNGISSAVPWTDYLFINPEVTVYLLREAEGEWIGVDAVTSIDPNGIGLADATLHDERGPFGRALQSLYVSKR